MSKQAILNHCKKHGFILDDNSSANYYDVTIWTNSEYIEFISSGASCLVLSWFKDGKKQEFWNELLNQLIEGTTNK